MMRILLTLALLVAMPLASACDRGQCSTCRQPQKQQLTAPAESATSAEASAKVETARAPEPQYLIEESPQYLEVPRRRLAIVEEEPAYYRLPARQLAVVQDQPAADVSAVAEVRSSSAQALRLNSSSSSCGGRKGLIARLRDKMADNRSNRETLRATRQALRSDGSTAISIAKSKG